MQVAPLGGAGDAREGLSMSSFSTSRVVVLAIAAGSATGYAPVAHAEEPHWSYAGKDAAAGWGDLRPEFASCKLGTMQSPIDIRGAQVAELPAIRFDYRPTPLNVVDNGHTIQVNYAAGSSIEVGGAHYELLRLHFHRPSEEKVDGHAHAMAVHLVHRNAEGQLAVVGVFLDPGGHNEMIDTVWTNLPKEKGKTVVGNATVDAAQLLPANRGYYTFEGSLTTPPCSEGVRWFVLKTATKIGDDRIAAFARIYPRNARPVQPLHGRELQTTR